MQVFKTLTRLSPWFLAFALISLFLCFATVFGSKLPGPFNLFNLRNESNFAALFSGIFLLVNALHSLDGWSLNRASRPEIANAWLVLSLVLIALSFDEIGSLHERVGSWWALLPFGLVFGGMIAYALLTFWRSPGLRKTAILICIGFSLFASVALQEYIEHAVDWSANRYLRFFRHWFRPVIEEGTELLGMLILLKVTMNNTRGILSRGERSEFPVFEAIVSWRRAILVTGLIGAPLIAYATVNLPPNEHGHGMPPDWPAAALFFLAALAAARPFFVFGRGVGWIGWGLVVIALAACASTILPPDSATAIPLVTALAGAAIVIWVLSSVYVPGAYVPAVIFLSAGLAATWFFGKNDFAVYTFVQYTALAFYWVNSSPSPSKPVPRG